MSTTSNDTRRSGLRVDAPQAPADLYHICTISPVIRGYRTYPGVPTSRGQSSNTSGNCSDLLCPGTESNCLHTDFQSVALPVELPGRLLSEWGTYAIGDGYVNRFDVTPSGDRPAQADWRRATVDCDRADPGFSLSGEEGGAAVDQLSALGVERFIARVPFTIRLCRADDLPTSNGSGRSVTTAS